MPGPHDVDAELPRGYWLRLEANREGAKLIDEHGRAWFSVRDAFWQDRLGFAAEGRAGSNAEALKAMLA